MADTTGVYGAEVPGSRREVSLHNRRECEEVAQRGEGLVY